MADGYLFQNALSGRSRCKGCNDKIEKDEVRLGANYGPDREWLGECLKMDPLCTEFSNIVISTVGYAGST